jgi:two-component system sensor histidine kinase BaeS
MIRRLSFSPLWLRLALAFVAVAIAAVALLAGLTLASGTSNVASLQRDQQQETSDAIVRSLTKAYSRKGSWRNADLAPAFALGTEAGANVSVFDASRHLVAKASAPNPQQGPGSTTSGSKQASTAPGTTTPLRVNGRTVGSVAIAFTGPEPAAVASLRASLVQAVIVGACLAALLAVAVALVVSRRISKPVAALTRVVRARAAGDRDARIGDARAPAELAELGQAFDGMADAVAREDELRRSLVADVAHELRTPISVLQASSEGLLDGVVEPSPEVISSIRDEILRLAHRVEDLQALASAQAAGMRLTSEPLDLAEIAGDAAAALAPAFAAAHVDLGTTLESVTVSGDPDRLHQVVTNLLTNALKFTPAGGRAWLKVSVDNRDARLTVGDNGPGLSEDELAHVFERFWRGSTAHGIEGSGIGLAIVAELVRIHRGTVQANSGPGDGSTFVVRLPRAAAPAPAEPRARPRA